MKEYKTSNKETVSGFFLKNRERQFSADDALSELASMGVSIPKSSFYRIIGNLTKKGVLKRFESGSTGAFAYQYANFDPECENHFHLKCSKCGLLIHLECEKLSEVKEHIYKDHGFLIGGDGIINGVCEKCKK